MVGRIDDTIDAFEKVLLFTPEDARIHYNTGIAYGKLNKFTKAIEHLKTAVRIDPNNADAFKSLGSLFTQTNELDEAALVYERAIELDPDNPEILNEYAVFKLRQGLLKEAVLNFRKVLQVTTDWVEPMNNLAWILAVHKDIGVRNPFESISLAEKVCKLTNNTRPDFLDTLAVAYAAAGRYSDAVDAGEMAMTLAQSSGNEKLTAEIQSRLLLFKAGKSYVE
jgi:tetratricopeptide (TPR) repeat protein